MITNFSKWLIYTASYLPLYPILIIRLLLEDRDDPTDPLQKIILNFRETKVCIIVLFLMLIISVITLMVLKNLKANSRHYSRLVKNTTYEIAGFLIPYASSFLTINLDWYGWVVNALIYFVCGMIMIMSDKVHLCPAFLFLGNKLYKDEKDQYIFTKLTKEQYNQLIVEEENGLLAKLVTKNVLLIKHKRF